MRLTLRLLFTAAIVLLIAPLQAAEKRFGEYTIHYNTFNSDFLEPQVAKAYGIQRSKNRAILNVTVTKSTGKGIPTPVAADITGTAKNVYEQSKPIELRKIEETGAIYYIAEFPIANEEIVNFEVSASNDSSPIGEVSFQQKFYTQ